ncbi:RteC domain-containing protein [Sinomicrobium sp. M5D2P9]
MVYEAVIANFNRELRDIKTFHHAMPEIRRGVLLCRKTLCRLQETVKKEGFHTRADEIYFFKEVKVHPLSWLIYFTEIGTYQLRKPRTGKDLQKQFYKKQLQKTDKFFQKHREFIYYMEQGYTHLDSQYFTRTSGAYFPFPFQGYRDPGFSTSHDLLWARVGAMERVVEFVKKAMLQRSPAPFLNGRGRYPLAWTGTKADLVELIYALYSGKVFNHGQADIADITAAFETFLDIRLPQVYKTYASIKARKGQRARFLEELIFYLTQKMDQDDAL